MIALSVALWVGGLALVALAVLQIRTPLARLSELDRLADNARRYDSWRGARTGRQAGADDGPTGADVMRQLLRRKVVIWGVVAGLGVVLIVVGFALR